MDIENGRKLFVEHWKRVGPLLEGFEHEELRNSNWDDNWEQVDGLLQFGFDMASGEVSITSGLVEQQRLFAKARR